MIHFYDSLFIYFGYFYLILLTVLCSQCLGHISGILFNNDQKISLLFAISIHLIVLIFSNSLIPIKEFHYSLQWLSEFSYIKHSFESILIMIYGFDRCLSQKFSAVLYKFDIDDKMFWSNSRNLLLVFIGMRFISLIVLIIKTNSSKRKKSHELHIPEDISMTKLNVFIPGMTSD
jgi:NADH:ubiquinone oxidoreductase subunit 2 (subunit N)